MKNAPDITYYTSAIHAELQLYQRLLQSYENKKTVLSALFFGKRDGHTHTSYKTYQK